MVEAACADDDWNTVVSDCDPLALPDIPEDCDKELLAELVGVLPLETDPELL